MAIQVNCEFCDAVFESGLPMCPTCHGKVTQLKPTSSSPVPEPQRATLNEGAGLAGDAEKVSSRYRVWTYIALVFLAPVGIAMLWMKPVVTSFKVKRNLSIASAVFFLIVMVTKGGAKQEDTNERESNSARSAGTSPPPVASAMPSKTRTEVASETPDNGGGIPPGHYVLANVSIIAKRTKANGKDWDGMGPEPDPEVLLFMDDVGEPFARCSKRSDSYSNDCKPAVLFKLADTAKVVLKVVDKDLAEDDPIGEASIELSDVGRLDAPIGMRVAGQLAQATITLVAASTEQVAAFEESERERLKNEAAIAVAAHEEEGRARLRAMCPAKGVEETSFKNGHLKLVMEAQDATDGWRYATIEGHTVLEDCAKKFEEFPELKSITIVEFAEVANKRGQVKKHKIADLKLTRKTAKKINWDNVQWKNIPKIIDKAWGKSGVAYLVD